MPPLDPEDTAAISDGPCQPWPVQWCDCTGLSTASPAVTGFAVQAATEVLWAQSGRQFGECAATIRPCRQDWAASSYGAGYGAVAAGYSSEWVTPLLFDGQWYNVACGSHFGGGCGCTSVEQVLLPTAVARVDQVVIDGVTLDPSAYRLDDRRKLVRQDGGMWPLCQDYSKPAGQPGTWTINIVVGGQVPMLGELAMGELACEFVKACVEPSSCALPKRIAEASRQGVTLKFVNALRGIDRSTLLMMGLTQCHFFLETFNPGRIQERARIYSPDMQEPRYSG